MVVNIYFSTYTHVIVISTIIIIIIRNKSKPLWFLLLCLGSLLLAPLSHKPHSQICRLYCCVQCGSMMVCYIQQHAPAETPNMYLY